MQTFGHIFDLDGNRINLLKRQSKYSTFLKLRKGGDDTNHLIDEQYYLRANLDLLEVLKSGVTVAI